MSDRISIDRDTGDPEHDTESLQLDFDGDRSLFHQKNQDYDSYTPPTTEEWKTMKGYGSFITHDEDEAEHTFHVHDLIHVLPAGMNPDQEDLDPNDLWVAEIRSIRAHDSESVWIKVKWFYHPTELPKNVKGTTGKLKRFGTFERISSNQADFIPTSTCCGVATIVPFNEQDTEQDEIGDRTLFYRYDYDWQARTLKGSPPPCSICKKAYSPDTDVMHFCPRPRCCRSWHTTCLSAANWLITSPVDLPQRLESISGDWTPTTAMDCDKGSPRKKSREESPLTPAPPLDPYINIPSGLLAVARQPIVRGGALGLVGNVRSVVRARKMLQSALKDFQDIPDDWEEKLGKVYDVSAIAPPKKVDKAKGKSKDGHARALAYQCPQCGEPI